MFFDFLNIIFFEFDLLMVFNILVVIGLVCLYVIELFDGFDKLRFVLIFEIW